MGAVYEREFKGILSGDTQTIAAVSKTLTAEDDAAYRGALASPFLVVRAAGSLGADLVALRHDVSFIVEVKSSKQARIHFSDAPRLSEQVSIIRSQCERSGVLPLYAYRRKGVRGDAWRLFTLPGLSVGGNAGLVSKWLPAIEKTHKGNDVLTWEHGMPLARFLERVCGPVKVPAAAVVAAPR